MSEHRQYPSEPRSCPLPKGPDGLCNHHRSLFDMAMEEQLTLKARKLLYKIDPTAKPKHRHPRAA